MTVDAAERSRGAQLAGALLVRLAALERGFTFGAFMVLIAVVFLDVASRELTGSGLHWASQAGVYANVVVVMLGLGLASSSGAHLRPRFADGWLPASWQPWLIRIQELLMASFCAGFAVLALIIVSETRALGEVSPVLGNPVWIIQACVPLAFGLATLRHGLYGLWPELRPAESGMVQASQQTLPAEQEPQ